MKLKGTQDLKAFLLEFENKPARIILVGGYVYETNKLYVYNDFVKFEDKFGIENLICISQILEVRGLKNEHQ